jgi:hypothetical protein
MFFFLGEMKKIGMPDRFTGLDPTEDVKRPPWFARDLCSTYVCVPVCAGVAVNGRWRRETPVKLKSSQSPLCSWR